MDQDFWKKSIPQGVVCFSICLYIHCFYGNTNLLSGIDLGIRTINKIIRLCSWSSSAYQGQQNGKTRNNEPWFLVWAELSKCPSKEKEGGREAHTLRTVCRILQIALEWVQLAVEYDVLELSYTYWMENNRTWRFSRQIILRGGKVSSCFAVTQQENNILSSH